MGECYWCHDPWCQPWGECRIPDYSALEEQAMEDDEVYLK